MPITVYDETIRVLKSAVQKAKLGRDEELAPLQRLDAQARQLERVATGPSVEQLVTDALQTLHSYGGRSVFGLEPPPQRSESVPLESPDLSLAERPKTPIRRA